MKRIFFTLGFTLACGLYLLCQSNRFHFTAIEDCLQVRVHSSESREIFLKFTDEDFLISAETRYNSSFIHSNHKRDFMKCGKITEINKVLIYGGEGDDILKVELANKDHFVHIIYYGGNQKTESGDWLQIVDNHTMYQEVNHHFINKSDGFVTINDERSQLCMIEYFELEPIIDNLNAVNRIFTFNGGSETINLGDDGIQFNNSSKIESTLGESVIFTNPTNSLTVQCGSGIDIFNLTTLDSNSVIPNIEVNGDVEDDDFNIHELISGSTLTLNGDEIEIQDYNTLNNTVYNVTENTFNANSTFAMISFSEIEYMDIKGCYGINEVKIGNTPDSSLLVFTANISNDLFTIDSSGAHSVISVVCSGGDDQIDIQTTGDSSISFFDGGWDMDKIIQTSSGSYSGVMINGHDANDVVEVLGVGMNSVTLVSGGGENDLMYLKESPLGTFQEFQGNAGVDNFLLGSILSLLAEINGVLTVDLN